LIVSEKARKPRLVSQLLKEKRLEEEAEKELAKASSVDVDSNAVVSREAFSLDGELLQNYRGIYLN
jgi:hypothetical protein